MKRVSAPLGLITSCLLATGAHALPPKKVDPPVDPAERAASSVTQELEVVAGKIEQAMAAATPVEVASWRAKDGTPVSLFCAGNPLVCTGRTATGAEFPAEAKPAKGKRPVALTIKIAPENIRYTKGS